MSKYTPDQIQKARDKADDAAAKFGMSTNEERAWIDTFTEALGLDVEDEKPEPGTYLTDDGFPVIIGNQGSNHGGANVALIQGGLEKIDDSWALRPARMVSESEWRRLNAKVVSQSDAIKLLRQSRDEWTELAHKAERETQKMPERVVPAEPVELAESDVCAIHNEHGHGRYFEDFSIEDRNGFLATVNAARRKLLEASK